MPRRARISLPSVSLHLIQRGTIAPAVFTLMRIIFFIRMYWRNKQKNMDVRSMPGV